jgi:hypothetical protein
MNMNKAPKITQHNNMDYLQFPFLELPPNYNYNYNYNGVLLPLVDSICCETTTERLLFKNLYELEPQSFLLQELAMEESSMDFMTKKKVSRYLRREGNDQDCWSVH